MKYTRKDYTNGRCSHKEYYSQFVNEQIKELIIKNLRGYKKSKDENLNDIPLREWDMLAGQLSAVETKLSEAGDYLTLAGGVCILKEAYREIYKL
jgi:hypothetical protein